MSALYDLSVSKLRVASRLSLSGGIFSFLMVEFHPTTGEGEEIFSISLDLFPKLMKMLGINYNTLQHFKMKLFISLFSSSLPFLRTLIFFVLIWLANVILIYLLCVVSCCVVLPVSYDGHNLEV